MQQHPVVQSSVVSSPFERITVTGGACTRSNELQPMLEGATAESGSCVPTSDSAPYIRKTAGVSNGHDYFGPFPPCADWGASNPSGKYRSPPHLSATRPLVGSGPARGGCCVITALAAFSNSRGLDTGHQRT